MTDRLEGIRREYEAGRVSADTYIAAGGDPDVVAATEKARPATGEVQLLRLLSGGAGFVLILIGLGGLISGAAVQGVIALVVGVALSVISARIGRR